VVGHALRPDYPLQATLDQGQSMLAHIEEIMSTAVAFDKPETFRQDLAEPLADLANSRTWVTTTVGTYDVIIKTVAPATLERLFERPEMRYMPPSVLEVSEVVLSVELEGLTPRQSLEAVLPAVGLAYLIENGKLLISRRNDPAGGR
jgi:hypothetical protein